jgi:ankyrin repeat protein
VIRYLVEMSPLALRTRDGFGRSLLTGASEFHRRRPPEEGADSALDLIRFLVDQWPDSMDDEETDGGGEGALHIAARSGAPVSVLSYLLQQRPDELRKARGAVSYLPAHCAAQRTNDPSEFESFRYLAELRPEAMKERTGCGDLPIHLMLSPDACSRPIVEAGVPWIQRALELTSLGESLLHAATRWDAPSLDTVTFLLELDGRIADVRSKDGSLPLHIYADDVVEAEDWTEGSLYYVRVLVEHRPESLLERDDKGRLPLHRAVASWSPSLGAVEYLVGKRPETLAERDHKRSLPLHAAVDHFTVAYALEVVQFLVEQRPQSLQERDNEGNLPLHLAEQLSPHKYMIGDLKRYLAEHTAKA